MMRIGPFSFLPERGGNRDHSRHPAPRYLGSMTNSETITPDEVREAFSEYLKERAESRVLLAQTVTDITVENRVVTITFDPDETLLSLNPFENLAEFPGAVIAFRNEECARIRAGVDAIATQLPDGTSLGRMTAAEIYKHGTGLDLEDDK